MIIDIHAHAFPDELAERAIQRLTYGGEIPVYGGGTCAGLSASMKQAGIGLSVIMPIATKPSQVRGINQWAAAVHEQHPDLLSFGALHPLMDDWRGEIERLKSDGVIGVKLHPDYQSFFVDETAMISKYHTIAEAGLILLFHAGVDIGLPPPVHCTPDRLATVLDAVPDLTVIAAHMGGYLCWDAVEQYLVGRDVYFDTSYSLADMGAERMASLIRSHGTQKVLFGTDAPWTDTASEVAGIRALALDIHEIDAVLGGNAEKLLGKSI